MKLWLLKPRSFFIKEKKNPTWLCQLLRQVDNATNCYGATRDNCCIYLSSWIVTTFTKTSHFWALGPHATFSFAAAIHCFHGRTDNVCGSRVEVSIMLSSASHKSQTNMGTLIDKGEGGVSNEKKSHTLCFESKDCSNKDNGSPVLWLKNMAQWTVHVIILWPNHDIQLSDLLLPSIRRTWRLFSCSADCNVIMCLVWHPSALPQFCLKQLCGWRCWCGCADFCSPNWHDIKCSARGSHANCPVLQLACTKGSGMNIMNLLCFSEW